MCHGPVSDLLVPIPRTPNVPVVWGALGLSHRQNDRIVQAFDDFVARTLEANLRNLRGRNPAKRNPMICTELVDPWAASWGLGVAFIHKANEPDSVPAHRKKVRIG